jgi:anti-sigma B factor antagonist
MVPLRGRTAILVSGQSGAWGGGQAMSGGTLAMRVWCEPGGIAVITVTGEVDIATVAGLRDRLFRLADNSRSVIVDLDQVSFTDAAGLGALVGAAHRADIHGASLQVVCDRPQTWELFRLAGLDRRLCLARTRAEALHAARGGDEDQRRAPTGSGTTGSGHHEGIHRYDQHHPAIQGCCEPVGQLSREDR